MTPALNLPELYYRHQEMIRPILRIGPIFGGIGLLFWRVRETRVPVTVRSILIPPLGMSTGFLMFLSPLMRVPWLWAVGSFVLGYLIFSIPLTRTSTLTMRDGVVYLQRSRAFMLILAGLLLIRLVVHDWVGEHISPLQTAALFFLLAFGMILRWRTALYLAHRKLAPTQAD